jgi:hypothetical protein
MGFTFLTGRTKAQDSLRVAPKGKKGFLSQHGSEVASFETARTLTSKGFPPVVTPSYSLGAPSLTERFRESGRESLQTAPIQAGPAKYDFDQGEAREASIRTADAASTFIPLDSWIYPAIDRLASLGFMPSSSAILRPLTRLECARLLAVAHVHINQADETTDQMLAALDLEFIHETIIIDGDRNRGASLESAYARLTEISGVPLRDAFHFAQSLADDYGRPYGEGPNAISGLSGRAARGSFAIYGLAEYQYASAIPAYNLAAQQALVTSDPQPGILPYGWNLRFGTTDRFRPVELYAAFDLRYWQLSFGQQALWWGPDRSTSLILSNNAAAMPMLRLTRVKPFSVPLLGPVHFDAFIARQGGVHYVGLGPTFTLYGKASRPLIPPPYIWGVAATLKITKNLEVGAAHTTIFAGYGRPLTFGTFLHSFSLTGNAQAVDPGKRVTEFNFSYRVPFLKKSFSVYSEAMAWDDPFQGKFVARYAMDPGIYLPEVPKIKNLDLRLEGAYTDLPKLVEQGYFYANAHYPQGYTNYGQILGSWVGRQGVGGQASSTYWFSPRKKVSLTYRKMVSDHSLFGGGSIGDVSANVMWTLRSKLELSASGQYERWGFPLLAAGPRNDFTSSFGLRWFPEPSNTRH